MNSRPLKAYVRYDGSGRVVSGSLILRKNKPKVGKWKEITAYECCNPPVTQPNVTYTVTYLYDGDPVTYLVLYYNCGDPLENWIWQGGPASYSGAGEVVDALNSAGILGEWSAVGDVLTLTASSNVEQLCPIGTLTLAFTRDI